MADVAKLWHVRGMLQCKHSVGPRRLLLLLFRLLLMLLLLPYKAVAVAVAVADTLRIWMHPCQECLVTITAF